MAKQSLNQAIGRPESTLLSDMVDKEPIEIASFEIVEITLSSKEGDKAKQAYITTSDNHVYRTGSNAVLTKLAAMKDSLNRKNTVSAKVVSKKSKTSKYPYIDLE